MALSAFAERNRRPSDADLRATLGKAYAPWTALLKALEDCLGPFTIVWKFTSASTGWGMRIVRKDRVIVYMTPQENRFLVSFALGERAVAAARAARLPAAVTTAIDSAPRYAEGRGIRIAVRDRRLVSAIARLAVIKAG